MIQEPSRDAIEWTPNTIFSEVIIKDDKVRINLDSETPNFKEYQMKKLPGGVWGKVDNNLELSLKGDVTEVVFTALNRANVRGPEHLIKIVAD